MKTEMTPDQQTMLARHPELITQPRVSWPEVTQRLDERDANRQPDWQVEIEKLIALWDSRSTRSYIGWQSDLEERVEALRALKERWNA